MPLSHRQCKLVCSKYCRLQLHDCFYHHIQCDVHCLLCLSVFRNDVILGKGRGSEIGGVGRRRGIGTGMLSSPTAACLTLVECIDADEQ